jgi:hypothetical protein
MLHKIDQLANPGLVQYTRPAVVTHLEANDDSKKLLVRIEHEHASFVIEARNALVQSYQPKVGDELLVSGENFRLCYIIGVLHEAQSESAVQSVTTGQGAVARRQDKNGHETLSIEDEQGHLLFEYDATEKKSKLYAAQGDLSLTALEGNIELVSGKNIHCKSLGGLTLESATAAQIRVASENNQTALTLSDRAMLLASQKLTVSAKSGDFRILDTLYQGDSFKGVLERSKLLVGKLETVAIRIMERAKNVYRQVEELQQTRANRVRTLVEGSYQLNSETTTIKSTQNVNIDGERIHLG